MYSKLSKLYNRFCMNLKNYNENLIRFITKKDDDDHFNNPFVIF